MQQPTDYCLIQFPSSLERQHSFLVDLSSNSTVESLRSVSVPFQEYWTDDNSVECKEFDQIHPIRFELCWLRCCTSLWLEIPESCWSLSDCFSCLLTEILFWGWGLLTETIADENRRVSSKRCIQRENNAEKRSRESRKQYFWHLCVLILPYSRVNECLLVEIIQSTTKGAEQSNPTEKDLL